MKVAYLCADRGIPIAGDKGASVHVREFVTALARLGHDVTLLCSRLGSGNPHPPARLLELPPDDRPAEVTAEIATRGIAGGEETDSLRREVGKLICDRRLAARAVEVLGRSGIVPDILYERYALFHRAGGAIASSFGVPLILEVNAPLVEEQERFRGLRLKSEAENAETDIMLRADHVIAVSEAVKDHVAARGVDTERITVLPNGVNIERFHPFVDGASIRKRHGLTDKSVIGFVGSLKPWHGLDFLLDALRHVVERCPGAVLLIVGDGPGLQALRERVAREGFDERVIFAGRVPHADVPCYLAATDVTVAPYDAPDGFYFSPLKVVESLAVGRPVVAPRLGQLERLIRDGETGLLYPCGDLGAFVDHLVAVLDDSPRRTAMGRRASAWARTHFSWDIIARRATDLMTRLRRTSVGLLGNQGG